MCTVITGKEQIAHFRLLQLRGALRLELKGLKHSRGSVYAMVKRDYDLRGNKQRVYDQFSDLVTEQTGVTDASRAQ